MATFCKYNDPSAAASTEGELSVTILCCTNFDGGSFAAAGCRRKRYRVQVGACNRGSGDHRSDNNPQQSTLVYRWNSACESLKQCGIMVHHRHVQYGIRAFEHISTLLCARTCASSSRVPTLSSPNWCVLHTLVKTAWRWVLIPCIIAHPCTTTGWLCRHQPQRCPALS